MNSIRLNLSPAKEKLPTGASKFLGNPDVWEGFEWPFCEEDGELFDLDFVCQINCAEIAPFDTDNLLPHTGMLYFFYDYEDMPYMCDEQNKLCRVIYYDGNIGELQEMVLVDDDENDISFQEQKITFHRVVEGFLSADDETHLMLGVPSLDYGSNGDDVDWWQMLLQVDSLETDDAILVLPGDGMLCFFIEPQKLKERDFSEVRAILIYS